MASFTAPARRLPRILWQAFLRIASSSAEVVRGAAGPSYSSYLAHLQSCHGTDAQPLSRRQFHRRELERRYRGVSRCC